MKLDFTVELTKYEDGSYSFLLVTDDDGKRWGRYSSYNNSKVIYEGERGSYSIVYSKESLNEWHAYGPISLKFQLWRAKNAIKRRLSSEERVRKAKSVVKTGAVKM